MNSSDERSSDFAEKQESTTLSEENERKSDQEQPSVEQEKTDTISEEDGGPMIKLRRESALRKTIGFAMARIEQGDTVTIQAYGKNMPRAITLVAIVRERLGHVHQVTSLIHAQDEENSSKVTPGIQMIISRDALDANDVGYQRAKPRGCDSFYFISKCFIQALIFCREISGTAQKGGRTQKVVA